MNTCEKLREVLTSIRDMTTMSGYCSPEMTARIFVIAQRALSLPLPYWAQEGGEK